MDSGESILPEGPVKGVVEALGDSTAEWVMRAHDRHVRINAKLSLLEKELTDTFGQLFDLALDEKVNKAAMVAALYPAKVKAEPVAALVVSCTFRQVLEERKAENRNLAKDSLRKCGQLVTMMES